MERKKKPRVQQLYKLNVNSTQSRGTTTVLFQLWRNLAGPNLYFLRTLVFPELMRFQEEKVSASGGDLGGALVFPKRIGFTGTLSELLPATLGQCGFQQGPRP
jgi:hypothetical protein